MAASVSLWIWRTISVGALGGQKTPYPSDISKPTTPDSTRVGRPGANLDRSIDVTASARTALLRICVNTGGIVANMTSARPAMTSLNAEPTLRYGTWTIARPVIRLKSSPVRCGEAPIPEDANTPVSPLALAYSMNSPTERAGDEVGTIMTFANVQIRATGVKSETGSTIME